MRVRSESVPHPPGRLIVSNSNGVVSTTPYYFSSSYDRTTEDVVVPGFKKRSAAGEVFNNPFTSVANWRSYSGSYHSDWIENGQLVYTYDYDHGVCIPVLNSAPTPTFPSAPDLFGSSGNKALASINSTQFNAPLFVAEWHKTRAMIPQALDLLRKTMQDYRAIRRGKGVKRWLPPTSKNLANAWLLGRFGVTPLLYELQGAVKALSKPIPVRATARGGDGFNWDSSAEFSVNDAMGQWICEQSLKMETVFRSGVLYENDVSSNLQHAATIGYTRPATVAWELIPWSFVIDRVVDIGTWLDAIQPNGAARYLAAWQGSKTTTTRTISFKRFIPGPSYGVRDFNSSLQCNITEVRIVKNRSPWDANPAMPVWNPYFNLKHLADYAALTRQRIRTGT